MQVTGPIGIFDSGYGGLTVLKSIEAALPEYDFLYLGDNARAPYGVKTFDDIHRYTRESVSYLFSQGCPLVILACNTASARALRAIQQNDLSTIQRHSAQRVLGVIRPTAEVVGNYTKTRHIGILGTSGTVKSASYQLEAQKFYPDIVVHQQACPSWVDFIESGQHHSAAARQQIQRDVERLLAQCQTIDCVLLACTHYPLVSDIVRQYLPESVKLLEQGDIVAEKTVDYLQRHPALAARCSQQAADTAFLTTGSVSDFQAHAQSFYGASIRVKKVSL